jgi:hypothetical protein
VQVTSAKPKLNKMFDLRNKTSGFHKQNVDAAVGADFMSVRLPSPIHSWSEQQRMENVFISNCGYVIFMNTSFTLTGERMDIKSTPTAAPASWRFWGSFSEM